MITCLSIQDKNLNTGNISISTQLAKAFYNKEVFGLVVLNELKTQVIEIYDFQELATLMGHLSPFFTPDGKKVSFYLAKRK